MPRTVDVTLPSDATNRLLDDIRSLEGIISIRVDRGVSVQPPGDVITIVVINRSLPTFLRVLDEYGIGQTPQSSFTTSNPLSVTSTSFASAISNDVSEATWEEMESVISKESNMSMNGLIIMMISGVIAAIGLSTNALHLVIGAMLIAPGFEPILRISFGKVTGSSTWRRGLVHTGQGYGAMFLGAILTSFVLQILHTSPLGGEISYLPTGVLVGYWTTITTTSVIVSAVASIAGAVLVASNRSVLTAGVMVALALVPAMTITGIALAEGDMGLVGRGFLRWCIDAGLIAGAGLLVFGWKQSHVHKRQIQLRDD